MCRPELLGLQKSGIHLAAYITKLLPKKQLALSQGSKQLRQIPFGKQRLFAPG
jgi:hypothetical protein